MGMFPEQRYEDELPSPSDTTSDTGSSHCRLAMIASGDSDCDGDGSVGAEELEEQDTSAPTATRADTTSPPR
jgi:hypothetical protein